MKSEYVNLIRVVDVDYSNNMALISFVDDFASGNDVEVARLVMPIEAIKSILEDINLES